MRHLRTQPLPSASPPHLREHSLVHGSCSTFQWTKLSIQPVLNSHVPRDCQWLAYADGVIPDCHFECLFLFQRAICFVISLLMWLVYTSHCAWFRWVMVPICISWDLKDWSRDVGDTGRVEGVGLGVGVYEDGPGGGYLRLGEWELVASEKKAKMPMPNLIWFFFKKKTIIHTSLILWRSLYFRGSEYLNRVEYKQKVWFFSDGGLIWHMEFRGKMSPGKSSGITHMGQLYCLGYLL